MPQKKKRSLRLKGWNSVEDEREAVWHGDGQSRKRGRELTCSCCCRASSICCRCFSICEAASFFCSSWAARSCSLRLISCVIIVESCLSFSARLSGVPGNRNKTPEVTQTLDSYTACPYTRVHIRARTLTAVWNQKTWACCQISGLHSRCFQK